MLINSQKKKSVSACSNVGVMPIVLLARFYEDVFAVIKLFNAGKLLYPLGEEFNTKATQQQATWLEVLKWTHILIWVLRDCNFFSVIPVLRAAASKRAMP